MVRRNRVLGDYLMDPHDRTLCKARFAAESHIVSRTGVDGSVGMIWKCVCVSPVNCSISIELYRVYLSTWRTICTVMDYRARIRTHFSGKTPIP